MPEENIFILENGDTLLMTSEGIRQGESVQSGIIFVDGLSVGDTSQDVLDERSSLASQGFISIAAAIDFGRKQLVGKPVVEMHGITGGDDAYLKDQTTTVVKNAISRALSQGEVQYRQIRKAVRDATSSLLWEKTKQRPMMVVNLLDV